MPLGMSQFSIIQAPGGLFLLLLPLITSWESLHHRKSEGRERSWDQISSLPALAALIKGWEGPGIMSEMSFKESLWTWMTPAPPVPKESWKLLTCFKNQSTGNYVPTMPCRWWHQILPVCASASETQNQFSKNTNHFFKKNTKCLKSLQEVIEESAKS